MHGAVVVLVTAIQRYIKLGGALRFVVEMQGTADGILAEVMQAVMKSEYKWPAGYPRDARLTQV